MHRFLVRQAGSQKTIEVRSQWPADLSLDGLKLALCTSLSQQGTEVESIEYVGPVDTGGEGLVVPFKEIPGHIKYVICRPK